MSKLGLFFILFIFLQNAYSYENVIRDSNGFIKCAEIGRDAYIFDWDSFIKTKVKDVRYLKVKSCNEVKFLNEISAESLQPIYQVKNLLSDEIRFSIEQVSEGATKFRKEKTAEQYISNHPEIFKPNSPDILIQIRPSLGDSFTEKVMTLWMKTLTAGQTTCEKFIGTCDFYLCEENLNPCGLDAYNLSYGYKYCSASKFKLYDQMKSIEGKTWVEDVFTCLQQKSFDFSKSLNHSDNSCALIKQSSFDSHPDCYANAGFCELNISEKEKIFNTIKKEIVSPETIHQGTQLLKKCAERQNEKG